MNQELFRYLPPEITIEILSRLPIRTIAICKCVRKPWRNLLHTREFVQTHLSKSVPGLIVGDPARVPQIYKVFEFIDEIGLATHDLHYDPVTEFDCSNRFTGLPELNSSANGLLLLGGTNYRPVNFYIANPITREYIHLPTIDNSMNVYPKIVAYGFGVSKMTGQYKVVRVFHEYWSGTGDVPPNTGEVFRSQKIVNSACHVYALGTGMWRSIAPAPPLTKVFGSICVSFNGNLHWLVQVKCGSRCILCFDLEAETFSTISFPPPPFKYDYVGLVSLGDCLCVCDNSSDDEIVVWLMKEYGDEKSWTKEFIIKKTAELVFDSREYCEATYPIKVFKDGDILMFMDTVYMFYYSNETKTTQEIYMLGLGDKNSEDFDCTMSAMLHTSSFLSLASFPNERVSSF